MTKLYCRKGHEVFADITWFAGEKYYEMARCIPCDRHYFEIDCLTHQIKNEHINPSELQWVNPKRESQIAIDRVVQALINVVSFEDVDIGTNSNILDSLIHELEKHKLEEFTDESKTL